MTADRQSATSRQQGRGSSCAESIPLGDRFQTPESVTNPSETRLRNLSLKSSPGMPSLSTQRHDITVCRACAHTEQSTRDARSVSGLKFAVCVGWCLRHAEGHLISPFHIQLRLVPCFPLLARLSQELISSCSESAGSL